MFHRRVCTEEVDRYYFSGGRMIRWLNHDKEWVDADNEAFPVAENVVVEWAEMLESASAAWPAESPE